MDPSATRVGDDQAADRPPRILFVNPPSVPYTLVVKALGRLEIPIPQPIAMPMGLLYLAAVLERDLPGVDIRIVDYAKMLREFGESANRSSTDFDEFVERGLYAAIPDDFEPDVVGLSILFSTAHKSTGHIADAIKRRWPRAPVVVGGMHATNSVETLLDMPAVDFVCRGEGESIVTDMVRRLQHGGDAQELPGVVGRDKLAAAGGGGACSLESAPLIEDLDEIPFPAWHLIPMAEYVHSVGSRVRRIDAIEQDREATLVTSRGCPFRCTFCASWTVHGRRMRFRSTGNVVRELERLHDDFGVNVVVPEDDLFTVKKPRIIELCHAIADRFGEGLQFQFPNGLSVATLDEEVIAAMILMGMRVANIAIESGSDYVQRKIIKKNCNLDRARRVVQACRDAGIIVRCYFIIGFPGETREHIQETLDFAESLPADWNTFNIAAPLIGSEMYEQMLERGDIGQEFNWDSAFFQERTFDTAEIGAAELKRLVYDANIRMNFFGNWNLRNGRFEQALSLFGEVAKCYPGHLAAHYCVGLAKRAMKDEQGWQDALDRCRRLLSSEDNEMAHQHLKQFPALFPELATAPAAVDF